MKLPPFPGELKRSLVERPFTTKRGRQGCQHVYAVVMTPEQRQWLATNYPEHENDKLMKASGLGWSTLHRLAREMNLQKSPEGLHRIMLRQGQKAKRTCEKNGYYDSIRGRKPSEQCRAASRQMWQDIRDGKREHPASIMKRKNPRKYRKWMENRSKERKETIRKEMRRVLYGMERKTRLKCIVMCKYTRRQVSHRYNALKRGYIIMDDCSEQGGERYNIYYDNETQRSSIFEKNLLKDGFQLKQWSE